MLFGAFLFKILEHRMSRGEFTVIDATCSKTKDVQQYKQLAEQYRYRIVIVDFTHIPLQVCLKQNKMRLEVKWVPETAIKNNLNYIVSYNIEEMNKLMKL